MVRRDAKSAAGWLRGVTCLLALAALTSSAGCTEEACFVWSEEEGSCPPQEEALQFFVPSGCFGNIESVDSEGEYIISEDDEIPGNLCCYTVTSSGEDNFCQGF